MPVSNNAKRLVIQSIANNINEMVIGFDGSPLLMLTEQQEGQRL